MTKFHSKKLQIGRKLVTIFGKFVTISSGNWFQNFEISFGKFGAIMATGVSQRAPKSPPNEDPPKSRLSVSVCSFSSLRYMKQLFDRQRPLPKTCVFFHQNEFLSPKVLDLHGCFSREESYHDQGDSLVPKENGDRWRIITRKAIKVCLGPLKAGTYASASQD